MTRILITIENGEQRIDAAVPPHMTAADLLTWIEGTVGSCDEHRSLVMPDGSEIDGGACLASVGVLDGMTLRTTTPGTAPQHSEAPPPLLATPELPSPLSMPERLLVTTRALLGTIRPDGGHGAWARAVSAWHWTDHDRRLKWLIARPSPARAPIISVSGHRSAEVGEQLALAFASTRAERVILVDGDPAGRLSRHLAGSRVSWDVLARDLSDPTFGRLQHDRLFARSSAGLPMIPATEGATGHIETVLHALSRHDVIAIVDEGPIPVAAPVGDHAVISTIGAPTTASGAIIAAWGSPAITDARAPHVLMDGRPYRVLELAATVAGTWARSELAGSDHGKLR